MVRNKSSQGLISSDHITTTGLDANVITVTGGYDLDTYVTQIRNDQISLAQTIGDLKAGNSNLLMNTSSAHQPVRLITGG